MLLHEMGTSNIRKLLAQVRAEWDSHSPEKICYTSTKIRHTLTLEEIAVQHLFAQHVRRQNGTYRRE